MYKIILLLLNLIIASTVYAGGLVKNGAGHIEMNFQHVYDNLPAWIKSCQNANHCASNGKDGKILSEIIRLVKLNQKNVDRLRFRSGQADPKLFNLGIVEPKRMAVTDSSEQGTIYINTDYFYLKNGSREMSLGEIAAFLIHELGHKANIDEAQNKENDHDYLNILGNRLRKHMDLTQGSETQALEIGENREVAAVTRVNQRIFIKGPDSSVVEAKTSLFYFNWENHYSLDLTKDIFKLAHNKCLENRAKFVGYEIFNSAFNFPVPKEAPLFYTFGLKSYCILRGGKSADSIQIRDQVLQIEFTATGEYNFKGLTD